MNENRSREPICQEEVKRILIDILKYFDGICAKYNISYSLGYGTLLGAARHKGFIPWDDDIDVMIPLPDYLRLMKVVELYDSSCRYMLHTRETESQHNEIYPYPFAKLVDEYTRGEYLRNRDQFGAYIDVFPIVGIPEESEAYRRFFKTFYMNKLGLSIGYRMDGDAKQSILQTLKSIRRRAYWTRYKAFRDSLLKEQTHYDYNTAKRVNVSLWNFGERENFSKELFKHFTCLPFGDRMYPCIASYEEYLTQMYGEWQVLPPEDQRKPRHEYKLFYR